MRRLPTLLLLTLATGLVAPSAAHAGPSEDYLEVYKAYQAAGVVNGCKFSAKKLASAKKGVPPDVDTYAPDFPEALDAALRQRAGGDCEKRAKQGSNDPKAAPGAAGGAAPPPVSGKAPAGGSPSAAATAAAGATGATGAGATTTTPAPSAEVAAAPAADDGSVATAASRNARATTADDAPFPLVLLAVLVTFAALAGLLWALARALGFDPPWLAAGRHATAEAGWRASASWAEFSDWVRLGR